MRLYVSVSNFELMNIKQSSENLISYDFDVKG